MSAQTANGITYADVEDYFNSSFILLVRHKRMGMDQRFGQAFMNALWQAGFEWEYNILTGSLADPFYKDDIDSILAAFEYILERK